MPVAPPPAVAPKPPSAVPSTPAVTTPRPSWPRRLARWLSWAKPAYQERRGSDDLATQVRDLELLHEATLRVARTRDWQTGLREILHAALLAVGSEKGLLSFVTEDGGGLRVGVSEGFGEEFVRSLGFIARGAGACGAAYQRRARVLVRDADTDVLFLGMHDAVHLGRFKAVHSVPLIARGGAVLGVLSAHFVRRHDADSREMRLLDLYAQMAVEFIERFRAEAALRASERQLQQVLSTLPASVYTCDNDGRITFFNQAAEDLWGRAPMLGRELWCGSHRVLSTDGREMLPDAWPVVQALRTGRSVRGAEVIIERPDGTRRHVLPYPEPIRDPSGRVTGVLNVMVDITARKEAENALRASEERLRAVTEVVPVMLMRCDAAECFEFANRAYLERRDLTLEQLRTRPIREIVGDEAYAKIRPYIARVLAGENVRYETTLHYKGVGERHVSVAYVPERDECGAVRGWVGCVTDITEHRRADAIHRELAAIVSSSNDAIIGTDLRGTITSWNHGAQRLFGYAANEMVGQPFACLTPDERARESEAILRRVRAGERIEHFLTRRLRRDGSEAQVSLTISPILDDEGGIVGASAIARDVTELQTAQRALHERTRMLQTVNQVSGTLVAELDPARIAANVLRAGCEVSGAALGAFFIGPSAEHHQARLLGVFGEAANLADQVEAEEFIAQLRNGASAGAAVLDGVGARFLSEMAVPVVSRSGELIGGLLFADPRADVFTPAVADILHGIAALAALALDNASLYQALERELSEKRRAEAELRAAQAQLQAHAALLEQKVQERTQSLRDAITQMEEFSYTVSHDLRAPLRAMNTYAQALVEDFGPQLDPTARHYLERIQRSSLRMEKLTHDVLTYSRLARSEIKLAPIDLDALLRDMLYQYAEFQPPHAEIKVKRPLHDVLGHEVSLGQCIANLLTNAVKFVAPGVQPRIRVHTELSAGNVRLWIADNGIGIDPQYQSRLFQVFERLHDRQQYEGTGIGLAIVRKAVDKMGGRCGVESDGCHGSRFWIELPPAPEHLSAHEQLRTAAAR
jgi:PAS domain S-box-containing protein